MARLNPFVFNPEVLLVYFRLSGLLMLLLVATALTQQVFADNLHDGEWELRVRQSVPGLPTGMAELRWRECLSSTHLIPTTYLQASSCDVLSQHMVYHTLHYKLSCFGKHGTFTNKGQIHFGRLRLSGNSKSDTGSVAGQNTVVRYRFTGQRIGLCP